MGRNSYSSRRIVEYSYSIRIEDLAEAGCFTRGPCTGTGSGRIGYKGSEDEAPIAEYSFTITIGPKVSEIAEELGGIRIPAMDSFIALEHDYKGRHYSGKHYIDRLPVHFGGFRWYFRCGNCGRRVKALYFGWNKWACRHCCGLVYRSSREHRNSMDKWNAAEIAEKRAEILRGRKHPRLANRLEWEACYLYGKHAEELGHNFGK